MRRGLHARIPLGLVERGRAVDRGADPVGGHTADVLRRVLGMSEERIEALARAGVVQTDAGASDGTNAPNTPF